MTDDEYYAEKMRQFDAWFERMESVASRARVVIPFDKMEYIDAFYDGVPQVQALEESLQDAGEFGAAARVNSVAP